MTGGPETSDRADWRVLCAEGDIAQDAPKGFEIGDRRLCAVFDGTDYFVLDDICSHGHAFLSEGYCDTEDCVVECPLHGGLFDYRDGSPQGDPVEKPQRVYPVRIVDGRVEVHL